MEKRILSPLFSTLILTVFVWNSAPFLLPQALARDSTLEKGPRPWLSARAEKHIEHRHIRENTFPEKTKFIAGMDYKPLVQRTYGKRTLLNG